MKKVAISLVTMWSAYTNNSLKTFFESDINNKNLYDCTLYIFINSLNNSMGREDKINAEILEMQKKYDFKIVKLSSINNEGITGPRISIMNEILKTNAEYFLEIHDDMIFTNDFFREMIKVFDVDKKYKIVMPALIYVDNLMTEKSEDIKARGRQGRILTESLVQSHPWLIKMELIKSVGYFDPVFSPQSAEDDDFYKRVYDAGYVPVHTSMSIVGHKNGETRTRTNLPYSDYNRLFESKHKMTIRNFQLNIIDKNKKEIKY